MDTIKVEVILTNTWPRYQLMEPIDIAGVHVPASFISNGASVPRVFWSLFPPVGKYFLAAVVHDYVLEDTSVPWKTATKIFDQALREVGVRTWKRHVMRVSVAIYGLVKRYK